MADKVKLAMIQLCGCSGCHMSLLDLHEKLLDVLPNLEIVYAPIIADAKEIPECDVVCIEGGARNEHEEHLIKEFREKAKIVVAWGTCAVYGGIPGLGNLYSKDDLEKTVYNTATTDNPGELPSEEIPELLDVVKPVPEIIDVDLILPGCPPKPEMNAEAIAALLEGRELQLPTKIVCDECPREKKGTYPEKFKRTFEGTPDPDRCLFEQGYTCIGMATRVGCGAMCPNAGVPCRGCYGKTDAVLDQGAAAANTYACSGDAALEIPDKAALFNRFTLPAALISKKIE
ncbi:MAG: F420-non-reducing hydrogenase small subunit [Methanothermococcus sp.]|jgi:F420-non-reducing hydrogenase small subunit|uniref:F420-non-reducing hydrogenase subunit VhuG n=1 Tax=Methanothermococcus TaxID=155862 RepID=UPI00036DBB44|nr:MULTISPECIES: F420-non-reducing hydrogenase subunit G [Methanothermococcus]MDK2790288.1 F420-non-reducing hydrogenase small subunit [Methanothermococcus sp.]MDK2987794.1 F420-non-reducing hydrogenase small subunit [Methanothermococcus sp.]